MTETVYLGLGSNLGDRGGFLRAALRQIQDYEKVQVAAVSSVYETEPVYPGDGDALQGDFLNIVVKLEAYCGPERLLKWLIDTERALGRIRRRKWGPREIDLDLLLYGDRILTDSDLQIPHPEMPNRAFVLVPLAELGAEVMHPVLGKSVAELLNECDTSGVKRLEVTVWNEPF